MFCSHCGALLSDVANFCYSCGSKRVSATEPVKPSVRPGRANTKAGLKSFFKFAGQCFVLLFVTVIWLFFACGPDRAPGIEATACAVMILLMLPWIIWYLVGRNWPLSKIGIAYKFCWNHRVAFAMVVWALALWFGFSTEHDWKTVSTVAR
ncbi:MAG: zinc-ribbon domain-containing protein [Terriglobales bacterium]